MDTPNARLHIRLNEGSTHALTTSMHRSGADKTTTTNRALILNNIIEAATAGGKELLLRDPNTGAEEQVWVV